MAADDREVADRIREGIARRRISRQQLANHAGISLSTLEKGLSGERPFTLATLVRIEEALGSRVRGVAPGTAAVQAAADLGGYRKEGVDWLTGTYLTIRPSFDREGAVYSYLTRIAWDDDNAHLTFSESDRVDARFAQKGVVSMPYQSGLVYLVTNEHGQFRTMTLSRPSIAGDMHGLLMTLRASHGGRLIPTAAPVALLRRTETEIDKKVLGQIADGAPNFAHHRGEIGRVLAEEFGQLIF